MHVTTSATWVALFEFLLVAFVFWSILHLLGRRPKLIALGGTAIVISVILAKLILM